MNNAGKALSTVPVLWLLVYYHDCPCFSDEEVWAQRFSELGNGRQESKKEAPAFQTPTGPTTMLH